MLPPPAVKAAAPRRPRDQAKLDQVGLNHFLDCITRFRKPGRERFNADRATAKAKKETKPSAYEQPTQEEAHAVDDA